MDKPLEELLTLNEAAKILNVNPQTLRRWDNEGILKAVRIGNRKDVGDRKKKKKDIEEYISKNKE